LCGRPTPPPPPGAPPPPPPTPRPGGGRLAASCAERPTAPRTPPLSPDRSLASACGAAPAAERLTRLQRGVEALPHAAQLSAQTRLLPALRASGEAIERGLGSQAADRLRRFVGEIAELRLRAPFEARAALAAEAQCLLEQLEPTTGEEG
jgi:hypothetical protein